MAIANGGKPRHFNLWKKIMQFAIAASSEILLSMRGLN
jgi:hypothetical protein